MPCLRVGNAIVCGFNPTYEFEGFLFEWHHYCGPSQVDRRDPSRIRDTTDPGFWDAMDRFGELSEEGRKEYLYDE